MNKGIIVNTVLITQKDVARKAGVSQPAVALALCADEFTRRKLRPETRERIQTAARQLGYVPHHAARSLKLGKTHTIALISLESMRHPYVYETIEQIRLEFVRHGYHLNLDFTYQPADEKAALTTLASGRCDGVLRFGFEPWARAGTRALHDRGLPVVVLQPWPDPDFDTIATDRREGGRLATHHLLERGHRTITAVVGPRETGGKSDRVAGYRQALQAAAGATAPLIFYVPVEGDVKALWEQIQSARPRPTAVFIYNDELALRLVQAVLRGGGRVPEDLAVVADGNTWIGQLSDVPITSVDQNHAELARVAVARMLERMKHPESPPRHLAVKPFLVERQSSRFKR